VGLILDVFLGKIRLMNIRINPVNIKLLDKQQEYLEKNLKVLEKVTKHYKDKADLTVNIGKVTSQQQTGEIFFAEANFAIPGKDIVYKTTGGSFEEVVKKLKNNLKSLIVKDKGMKKGRFRRLARLLKRKLHL
jgi:ribosome-associated translation inhibitor RaiA